MCQPPGRSSDLRPLNIKATTYTRRGDDEFVVGVERRIHEELHANVRMYVGSCESRSLFPISTRRRIVVARSQYNFHITVVATQYIRQFE